MAVQAQHHYSENLGLGFCGSSSHEWMENVSGGGGGGNAFDEQQLYLSLQQQQQQQLQLQQQQQQMMIQNQQQQQRNIINQNLGGFGSSNDQAVSCSNNHLYQSMELSQSVLIQVEKQKQEIDRFIALQNERLRLALHEQRRQQLTVLLTSLESKALNLLRQKDMQLADATKKTMELEACLRKAEMENQAWQRVAKENEAMVIALNSTLQQVRESPSCYVYGAAEDTGSCCNDFSNRDEEEGETKESKAAAVALLAIDEGVSEMKMVCKGCKSRKSCVLFLPCRHLCSCKSCEAFLSRCPVCKSVKKASIEVYMS